MKFVTFCASFVNAWKEALKIRNNNDERKECSCGTLGHNFMHSFHQLTASLMESAAVAECAKRVYVYVCLRMGAKVTGSQCVDLMVWSTPAIVSCTALLVSRLCTSKWICPTGVWPHVSVTCCLICKYRYSLIYPNCCACVSTIAFSILGWNNFL